MFWGVGICFGSRWSQLGSKVVQDRTPSWRLQDQRWPKIPAITPVQRSSFTKSSEMRRALALGVLDPQQVGSGLKLRRILERRGAVLEGLGGMVLASAKVFTEIMIIRYCLQNKTNPAHEYKLRPQRHKQSLHFHCQTLPFANGPSEWSSKASPRVAIS